MRTLEKRTKTRQENGWLKNPQEHFIKFSKIHTGKKVSDKQKEKQRKFMTGRKDTEETKKKKSESLKLSWKRRKGIQ
mgnify:CR=1 FL=1